jgi:hypothetical protein
MTKIDDNISIQPYENEKVNKFSYMFKAVFYFLTFQKNKLKDLETNFNDHLISYKNTEELDVDKERKNKRLSKLKDSDNRINELKRLYTICKDTVYENKIKEILDITINIHEKYKNDLELNIYRLEQFHTYHTDRFLDLIIKATLEIVDIKILMPEKVGYYYDKDTLNIKEVYYDKDTLNKKQTDIPDINTTNLFDIVDEAIFNKAQQILTVMNPTWRIKKPVFYSSSELIKMASVYEKVPDFKRLTRATINDYILIGTVADPYVILLNKNGSEILQINIMTNFIRIIKLNKNV